MPHAPMSSRRHAKREGEHDTYSSRWRSRCACGWRSRWEGDESKAAAHWPDHMLNVLEKRAS